MPPGEGISRPLLPFASEYVLFSAVGLRGNRCHRTYFPFFSRGVRFFFTWFGVSCMCLPGFGFDSPGGFAISARGPGIDRSILEALAERQGLHALAQRMEAHGSPMGVFGPMGVFALVLSKLCITIDPISIDPGLLLGGCPFLGVVRESDRSPLFINWG